MKKFDITQALEDLKSISTLDTQAVVEVLNIADQLRDDSPESLEIADTLIRQAVHTLYQVTQIRVKALCVACFQLEKEDIQSLTSAKAVFTMLSKQGIDLAGLKTYGAYDEVRLLNNSVMHNSYVKSRDPLSHVYGWHVGSLPSHKILRELPRLQGVSQEFCEEIKQSMVKLLEKVAKSV